MDKLVAMRQLGVNIWAACHENFHSTELNDILSDSFIVHFESQKY